MNEVREKTIQLQTQVSELVRRAASPHDLYAAIHTLCEMYLDLQVEAGAKHCDELVRKGEAQWDIDDHVDFIESTLMHVAMSFSDSIDNAVHEEGREIFYDLIRDRMELEWP